MRNSGKSGCGIFGILAAIIVVIVGMCISKIILWGIIILAALVIAGIVLLIVFSTKKKAGQGEYAAKEPTVYRSSDKDKPSSSKTSSHEKSAELTPEQSQAITDARRQLMDLRRVVMQIHTVGVRTSANDVCALIDKIIQTLKKKPDKIRDSRQCLNYYIPTIRDVLSNFKNLETAGQVEDEMTAKVLAFAGDVKTALSKQYDNLFDSDKLDMEVDMEALTIAVKRDGLLQDDSEAALLENNNGENNT